MPWGLDRLGLIKTSLLDYPGEPAAVVFTGGCNLRCPWCQNPLLVTGPLPEDFLSRQEVLDHLRRRRNVLNAVVVTGGEPLFHQDLARLLEEIKAMGYRIKLDTNGTFPRRLAGLATGLVDFVAMDIKIAPERYHLLGLPQMETKLLESVALIRARHPLHEFRLTWVPGLNRAEDIPRIAAVLGAGETIVVTGFRPGATLDPAFAGRRAPAPAELEEIAGLFTDWGIAARLRIK